MTAPVAKHVVCLFSNGQGEPLYRFAVELRVCKGAAMLILRHALSEAPFVVAKSVEGSPMRFVPACPMIDIDLITGRMAERR
jgi:hypothetical protein